ncbi:hypothetical protein CBR_g21806 [Chara braunii]|uniref:Uncharacterized protein n=1 Tax=Chara braunii TaxID=69332 RepID=A0A388JUS0_CHABU|nr:hypothetical protein CBR_g21806 [Chara braunii]|eukprot:GBG61462.1 hypothetical protein CBR_g21806 [Chara braunii]
MVASAWEQAYASGMTSGTPEISALLTSLEALDPTCHEALILEMKGSEVDRMNRIHGNVEKKQGQKVVKKPEGQSEASSGKGPSFYYQESVLELLSQLYKRTLADAYRAGPVPVRSALEEFVSQWVQDQDDSRFEKLSLKVRIYAISMIENYLLYTTASLKAVASQAASANVVGSSTEDSSPLNTLQQKSLVPSLSYRQKVFRNLTVKWVRGARSAAAKSQRLGGYARVSSSVDSSGVVSENPDATGDTDAGSVGYPASDDALSDGQGDEESAILELEIAVARAVKALIGMGPVNDSPFETDILRFLQNHHSKGGPVVRENVREALAQLLEHNAHRLKNFIAASFKLTWIRKSVDKLEAKELALTYFRALVQTVSRRVDDWLNAHIVSPAKMSYLCLLHMCSHNEPMRHLALELINAIEAACPIPSLLVSRYVSLLGGSCMGGKCLGGFRTGEVVSADEDREIVCEHLCSGESKVVEGVAVLFGEAVYGWVLAQERCDGFHYEQEYWGCKGVALPDESRYRCSGVGVAEDLEVNGVGGKSQVLQNGLGESREAGLEELNMSRGSVDILSGLVIGSSREGISDAVALVGGVTDGQCKLGEKLKPLRLAGCDILRDLVEATREVDLCEVLGTMEAIKKLEDARQGVIVLDRDPVEGAVVCAHVEFGGSAFLDEEATCAKGGGAWLNESFFKEFIELSLHFFGLGNGEWVAWSRWRSVIGFQFNGMRDNTIRR